MTNREFFVAVANFDGISADLADKANELIASLDAKNEKRKSTDSKAKKETAERRNNVLDYVSACAGQVSRDEVAAALGITVGQATSALTALVKDGMIEKSTVKIDKMARVVYSYHHSENGQ